jgi:hypothetical protein
MTAAGYSMSSSHASRFEKENMPAFDIRFIHMACNVLQCLPNELYDITVELAPGEEVDPMLTLPRHALVLRSTQSVETKTLAPNGPTEDTRSVTVVATTQEQTSKKKQSTKKAVETPNDTGPSGAIFPFIKG